MTKFRKSTRNGAAALTLVLLVALPTAAAAWDRRVEAGWDHFVECAGWLWLFTDIASYEAYCLPPHPKEIMEGPTTPEGGRQLSSSSYEIPSSSYEPPSSSSEPTFSSSESTFSSSESTFSSSEPILG